MSDLRGTRALVTGGGTGIGAAVAARLQAAGAHVTVMGRREAPLAAVSPHYVVGDLTRPEDCRRAVEVAGPLDILVHNATPEAGVVGTTWSPSTSVEPRPCSTMPSRG